MKRWDPVGIDTTEKFRDYVDSLREMAPLDTDETPTQDSVESRRLTLIVIAIVRVNNGTPPGIRRRSFRHTT